MKRSTSQRRTDRAAKPRLRWLRSPRLWMAMTWLGTFVAVGYGLQQLEPYARQANDADLVIEWVDAPAWLGDANWEHVLPDLEARIDLHPRTDPYDDCVCSYVASRLAGSAWIERIRGVTKQADGRVKVEADFRKPFAMVECDNTVYLVDNSGVRLPTGHWPSRSVNRAGWLVIRGVEKSVPLVGEHWPGEDLSAGLKLADFLYRAEAAGRLPFRDSIAAIDVSNYRGRKDPRAGRLQLITKNPESCIHWGLPPGEEYGIEAKAELKLAMLHKLYQAEGRLPEAAPIDVRADDGIALGEPE